MSCLMRCVLALSLALLSVGCVTPPTAKQATTFEILEQKTAGRLGVFAIDTQTGRVWQHRADERFLMCSTFKVLLAAQVLARVDAGEEHLDRLIHYSKKDLLDYAPVTRAHVGQQKLAVSELAAAAVQVSDNTAANLLFQTQGGPKGLTHFLRSLGDSTTRSDRTEPDLNTASKDLDTTTPRAMAQTLQTIFRSKTLSPASFALLNNWLLTNTTSAQRFRAGLSPSWKVADKTGTGSGHVNDVGILYSPAGGAIVVAAFVSSTKPTAELESTLADVAREIAAGL
jgi:beta-lactamase class A